MNLAHQRCVHHPAREAAARCPACRRHFCRECVTEHEGRYLCATCLQRPGGAGEARRRSPRAALRAFARMLVTGIALAAWFCLLWGFHTLGGILLQSVPHRFHDSTVFELPRDNPD